MMAAPITPTPGPETFEADLPGTIARTLLAELSPDRRSRIAREGRLDAAEFEVLCETIASFGLEYAALPHATEAALVRLCRGEVHR